MAEGYKIFPRGKAYRDNFDQTFGKKMGYAVGDKVEIHDAMQTHSAYLTRISTCKYRTQPGILWELRRTRTSHEFYRYEGDIGRIISSGFDGY